MNLFDFGSELTMYGLIIGSPWRDWDKPLSTPISVRWQLKLFPTASNRHRAILYQQRQYPNEMLYGFEIKLIELMGRASLIPTTGRHDRIMGIEELKVTQIVARKNNRKK